MNKSYVYVYESITTTKVFQKTFTSKFSEHPNTNYNIPCIIFVKYIPSALLVLKTTDI